MLRPAPSVVIALLFAACDTAAPDRPTPEPSDVSGPADPPPPTWWQDIAPLIGQSCGGCHAPGGIGPFPLTTYQEVVDTLPLVELSVSTGRMPPWLPGDEGHALRDDLSLPEADRELLFRWIDAGAPEGDRATAAPARPPIGSHLSRVDATLSMTEPYFPTETPDEYRCFVLEWPFTTTKYVTGHRVRPGNTTVVHHALGFLIGPENVPAVRAFDAADPAPGYRCFGGPTAEGAEQLPLNFLASWAPGGEGGLDRPAGTGIQARPGSLFVMQIHYNTDHPVDPTPDLTAIDFSLEDEVATRAFSIAWFDVRWFFEPELMDIPAGKASVVHTYEALPSQSAGVIALSDGETYPRGMWLHSAMPHMHTFGQSITIAVVHPDGTRDTLMTIPKWDFHWQREYVWQEPASLDPGDKLAIECEWDNSVRAQPVIDGTRLTPRDLTWGEGTADEMCLALIYVTPK